jgi:hypothetical protein
LPCEEWQISTRLLTARLMLVYQYGGVRHQPEHGWTLSKRAAPPRGPPFPLPLVKEDAERSCLRVFEIQNPSGPCWPAPLIQEPKVRSAADPRYQSSTALAQDALKEERMTVATPPKKTIRKLTLSRLIANATQVWASSPMGSRQERVSQEIRDLLLTQQQLGEAGSFQKTAKKLFERLANEQDATIRTIYTQALAAVQDARYSATTSSLSEPEYVQHLHA